MGTTRRYLIAVKTKGGYFYSPYLVDENNRASVEGDFGRYYLLNGTAPEPSWKSHWYFSKSKPEIIEHPQSPEQINHRFELINPEMASDKIPSTIKREDACNQSTEYRWEYNWKPELAHLKSLYEAKHDEVPQPNKVLPFELNILMEVAVLQPPQNFSYQVKQRYDTYTITERNIEVCLLDQLTFPEIMHHTRPCRLSSKEVYQILRQEIIKGINPELAKITSDYDFCFNVAKLIPLPKPENYSVCTNLFSRGRKHYVSRVKTHKELPFFQMTHAEENYKGYTAIDPIIGKDAEDLKGKLEDLISSTLKAINTPIKLCRHCGGLGYKEQPGLPTNKGVA